MSLEAEIKRGGLDRGRYFYFPVAPGRVEFTVALRRLLLEQRPQVVAVELPSFLEQTYRRALARLPEITREVGKGGIVVLNLSGRGDKDVGTVAAHLGRTI